MRRSIVNIFFIIQLLAAAIEFVAAIVGYWETFDSAALFPLYIVHLIAVALLILFIYITTGTQRLPYRTYVPIVIFTLLPTAWLTAKYDVMPFIISVVGLGVSFYSLIERRSLTGQKFGWLSKEFFEGAPFNRFKGCVIAASVAVLLITTGVIEGYKALEEVLAEVGDGNVILKPTGIYGKMKTYQKDGKTVYLIAMAHVGDETFYKDLLAEIPVENSVVMIEGIKDSRSKLKNDLGHKARAEALGLAQQTKALNQDVLKDRKIQNVDIDIENISPEAQKYIEFTNGKDMSSLTGILMNRSDDEKIKTAEKQFHKERNDRVILFFDYLVTRYDHLIIPWGAAHIKPFSKAMEERGYTLIGERENKIIGF